MTLYQVYLPNDVAWKLPVLPIEERKAKAQELLDKWTPYCLNAWDKDDGNIYSPANKVKRFLNSLAYYLLLGNTEGIVTDYKDMMNGKREIPISSCPTSIENIVYSSSSMPKNEVGEDMSYFLSTFHELPSKPSKKKKNVKTRYDRVMEAREEIGPSFRRCIVDTENHFTFGDDTYVIDVKMVPQYDCDDQGIYGMDNIWVAYDYKEEPTRLGFYDQDFNKISSEAVHRID